MLQDNCLEAKKGCLLMCKEDEEDFVKAVQLEYKDRLDRWGHYPYWIGVYQYAKDKLLKVNSFNFIRFTHVEYESGKIIKKCAENGVKVQWAFMGNEDDEKWKKCFNEDRNEFLTSPYLQSCPFMWLSQQHRYKLYWNCLINS